jgi:hypothetical protein
MRTVTRHAQRGLSIIGFLFVAAVVVAAAMIGFRVLPAYIEYLSVQRALNETMSAMADATNIQAIRRDIEGRLNVNYVDSIKAADIQLAREGNTVTAFANWERKLHMVGNAYILLEFEAAASR